MEQQKQALGCRGYESITEFPALVYRGIPNWRHKQASVLVDDSHLISDLSFSLNINIF